MPPSLHPASHADQPMNRHRRQFLQVAAGTAGLLLTSSCTPAEPPSMAAGGAPPATTPPPLPAETDLPAAPPAPGLLRVALTAAPDQLDPALFAVVEAYPVGFAVYDGLTWVDQQLAPQPMLAETWEVDEDGLNWTFQLRQNVTFHHGSPLHGG